MNAPVHTNIDAHEVHERIWVGSRPSPSAIYAEAGFTHLVLCADEHQQPASDYPGITVIHAPFFDVDAPASHALLFTAFLAARVVAESQQRGGKVLVTCLAGINRSALVASLAMQMLGVEPWASVERLRAIRYPHCLSNEAFKRIALGTNRERHFFLPRAT